MKYELNEYKAKLTDDEILIDIQKTAKRFDRDYISISFYKKYGKYSQTAIKAHFGSWKNALALAGLRNERTSSERKLISDEEYYEDLQRVASILKMKTVPYSEYKKYGKYSAENIIKRFGKWNNALERAGLESTGFCKDKITKRECFDEIERIWILLGRQPTSTDIINTNISKYSIDTFKRRFGGWRKALEEFVAYINESENKFKNHHTHRDVNPGLRVKVFNRDHSTCCMCGASPRKDPSVTLHVDHIIPWSRGGETEFENLQTLCSVCNLGKGDSILD